MSLFSNLIFQKSSTDGLGLFFNFRYTPWYLYPEISYPQYCYGPMYILSVPAIRTLTKLFEQDFQHFLWLEDVYLTGKYKFITMQTGNYS